MTDPRARPSKTRLAALRALSGCLLFALACNSGAHAGAASETSSSGTVAMPTSNAPSTASEDAAVPRYAKAYLDLLVRISPEAATALGLHARDADLDDRNPKAFAAAVDREQGLLDELNQHFRDVELGAAARTDLMMLRGALEVDIRVKRERRPLETEPDLYASPLNAIFLMTARDYAPAAERAKNVIARLEKVPAVVEAGEQNLKNPPRVWTEIGIERASSAKEFLDAQREFLEKNLPNERGRVDAALDHAIGAYDGYAVFLKKQVLARSKGSFAAGRELFSFLLAHDCFLDESVDDLYAMGQKLVIDLKAQLTEVAHRIDPKSKSFADVLARLKTNHPPAAELVVSYRKEVARARKFLVEKDVVAFPLGEELEVVETPAFLRNTETAAYDEAPPFDAVKKGLFFVTPIDASRPKGEQEQMLREHDHGDQVDTAVHETYPGHHLQLSFARLNPSLVRKALGPSIFAEGWALYAEELMAELGYYTDEERLFQLEWALVRAVRIVIDIGLHVKNMSFDDAVAMLVDEVHLERPLALSEVKRYTQTPTQPLSYMIGRQLIFKLRERYRAREGASFSLKRFHTDVLARGTVAPSLLEKEIFGG